MEVNHREYPDYEEEAATMVRVLGPEKHVVKPLPQPQPRTIPGLQLVAVAVTSARRRILPQVVTAVKFDVPAGATGVLEVRLHPGYAHLNLEVLMGIVDTRHNTMKVPVLNHSDMAQVLDKGVPLIEVRASDFVVLDDIDYDSESGEEPARPSEVQMAAFEANTESTYTEAERIALQRATPEDRQRWCDTLAQYKHGAHLTEEQRVRLGRFLELNREQFAFPGDTIGYLKDFTHVVDTGDAAPVVRSAYRLSHGEKAIIEKEVEKMLRAGVIVPIKSGLGLARSAGKQT